jgi:hypothetical protein
MVGEQRLHKTGPCHVTMSDGRPSVLYCHSTQDIKTDRNSNKTKKKKPGESTLRIAPDHRAVGRLAMPHNLPVMSRSLFGQDRLNFFSMKSLARLRPLPCCLVRPLFRLHVRSERACNKLITRSYQH